MFEKIALIFFAFIFASPLSGANDSIATTPGPDLKLEKSDDVRMISERLQISPERIRVEYVFRNEGKQDLETTVAFPLAEFWGIYHGSAGGGESQFPNFKVVVGEKPVPFKTRDRVTFENKVITAELEKLGVPTDRFVAAKELSKRKLEELKKRGWYSTEHIDGDLAAIYQIQRTHYWTQRFPKGTDVRSIHSYIPQLGSNSIGGMSLFYESGPAGKGSPPGSGWKSFFPKNYEPTTSAVGYPSRGSEIPTDPKHPPLAAEHYEYVLSTGSHWKNGIEDFGLEIGGAAVIFVDIDGRMDFDLGSYRFKKKNFKPKRELLVEYLGRGKKPILSPSIPLQKVIDGPAICRASPKGKVRRKIPDGTKVVLQERKGDWYRIIEGASECWTHRKNLVFLPEAA